MTGPDVLVAALAATAATVAALAAATPWWATRRRRARMAAPGRPGGLAELEDLAATVEWVTVMRRDGTIELDGNVDEDTRLALLIKALVFDAAIAVGTDGDDL